MVFFMSWKGLVKYFVMAAPLGRSLMQWSLAVYLEDNFFTRHKFEQQLASIPQRYYWSKTIEQLSSKHKTCNDLELQQ